MNNLNKQSNSTVAQRKQAMVDAVASIKAEGLTPSFSATKHLNLYVQGKISADQLYQQTLADIKARSKQTVS